MFCRAAPIDVHRIHCANVSNRKSSLLLHPEYHSRQCHARPIWQTELWRNSQFWYRSARWEHFSGIHADKRRTYDLPTSLHSNMHGHMIYSSLNRATGKLSPHKTWTVWVAELECYPIHFNARIIPTPHPRFTVQKKEVHYNQTNNQFTIFTQVPRRRQRPNNL